MIDPADALLTTAELALGLAGFSGVVAAFRTRSGPWLPADAFRLASLLSVSLAAMFLALLPLALAFFPLTDATCWRVCGGLMAAYTLAAGLVLVSWMRRLDPASKAVLSYPLVGFVLSGSVANAIIQALNAGGVFGNWSFAVYFAGLVWLLFYGGVQFGRILFFRPQLD